MDMKIGELIDTIINIFRNSFYELEGWVLKPGTFLFTKLPQFIKNQL